MLREAASPDERARIVVPGAGWQPFTVATTELGRAWGPVAFDWITVVFVRTGTLILTLDRDAARSQLALGENSALLLRPECDLHIVPEGRVQVSLLWVDQDWLAGTLRSLGAVIAPAWLLAFDDLPVIDHHATDGWVRVGRFTTGEPDLLAGLLDMLTTPAAPHQWPPSSRRLLGDPLPTTGLRGAAVLFEVLGIVESHLPHVAASPDAGQFVGTPPRPRRPVPLRAEARMVATWLRAHPEAEWRLSVLARQVALSPKQLQRVFVTAYGVSPSRFVTRLRVEHMAHELVHTGKPVAVIAAESGWAGRSFATAQFHKLVGLSPTEYRHRYRSAQGVFDAAAG